MNVFKYCQQKKCFIVVCISVSCILLGCMTSQREEDMARKIGEMQTQTALEISKLREELLKKDQALGNIKTTTDDANKKVQGTKGDVEDLRRQLNITQGAIDELQTKFSRFVDASTKSTAQDSQLRFTETDEKFDEYSRKLARLELILKRKDAIGKGKLNIKINSSEDLEKMLSNLYAQKDFKKSITITTQILNAEVPIEFDSIALRFRAEAHFAAQDYEMAAIDIGEFISRFPKNSRYYRMLLLAGDSWVYLKNYKIARSYYQECVKMSPDKPECIASKDRLHKIPGG